LRILGLGKGAEIGAAVALEIRGKTFVPLHDQSGNVVVLVDMESKRVVENYRYSAFGEESVYDAEGEKTTQSMNPWRFSSKRVDPETGFSFFGRRYYDSVNGRWVTADPLGFEGGPNLYAYVLNSPLTHFDLYGLYAVGTGSSTEGRGNIGDRSFFDRGMKFATNMIKGPGRILEYSGQHLVPIPIVRDGIEVVGRIAAGKGLKGYTPSWKIHSEHFDLELPEKNPLVLNMMYNGMNTSRKEQLNRLGKASELIGGYNMHAFWTADHGYTYNAIGAALQKIGVSNNAVKESIASIKKLFAQMDAIAPGKGILNIHAFSQGNLVMNLTREGLPERLNQRINLYSYGSPVMFIGNEFGKISETNHCQDPVARCFSPVRNICNWYNNINKFQHGGGLPFCGHKWDNDFYQTAFQENLKSSNKG
jgi:RHS repeat-associated protein